ncbi:hypothetical protein [Pseudomonas sp. Irchel 3A7]|uniref:hypothetical protein n=1 Tax=Pseudomonas sp. Irchel 3A7 TaxID=2008913 RepID=UPI000BA4DD01|nr:hypothetical protein [Pseudomonas sp. Irchel 3A7]
MTARIGAPKTGGRRKGSLDKGERQLVTAEMAADIMTVYRKLGGVRWLLKFAQDNPAEFLRQGLSRLMPAPQKDDPDVVNNTQINVGNMSDIQIAARVAFALSKGLHAQKAERVLTDETVEPVTPQEACDWRNPIGEVPPSMTPVDDPQRRQWASELPLSPQEKADQALIRQTRDASLTTYAGSGSEHGGGNSRSRQPQVQTKRTVSQIRRDQLL